MREGFSGSESGDELPTWSLPQLAQAKESLTAELFALSKKGTYTGFRGPAYVLNEDGTIRYFHLIEAVAGDVHIISEPLSRLDVNNAADATRKAADHPDSPGGVKGYSFKVLVAWGGSPENVESLYATVATTDQARLEQLQREVASKILEVTSLSAVRDWLLQQHQDIVQSVTLEA